jgi:hypothetical protein
MCWGARVNAPGSERVGDTTSPPKILRLLMSHYDTTCWEIRGSSEETMGPNALETQREGDTISPPKTLRN